jgi:hypothetical protein
MQLADRLTHAHGVGIQLNFFGQISQVGFGPFMVLRNDFVASTVVAQRFTKRNVNVD